MLELNFTPFPVLETERLLLRQISENDAENIFLLRTNEDAMKFIHKPKLKSLDEAKELIKLFNKPERVQWGISLKAKNKIIGIIGYHRIENMHYRAEVGYMLHPDYWNSGIISEAIKHVIDFGFKEMKLHSIEAVINPNNIISRKILQKFNFIKEAYFKENFFFEGKFYDSEAYSLVKK